MASLNDKHYSSTSAQEQRERGDFKEDEREKEPIGTKVIEPRKGRGLPVCEHAARGGTRVAGHCICVLWILSVSSSTR